MNKLAQMRRARKRANPPAGLSTTGSVEMCVIEAELAAEGRAQNYHIPADESVLGQVQARCKEQEIEPAWVVVDGIE